MFLYVIQADKVAADAAAHVAMMAANEQRMAERAAEAERRRVEERE
jgi:hypothetical protein